jgi:hypothetical protein
MYMLFVLSVRSTHGRNHLRTRTDKTKQCFLSCLPAPVASPTRFCDALVTHDGLRHHDVRLARPLLSINKVNSCDQIEVADICCTGVTMFKRIHTLWAFTILGLRGIEWVDLRA